MRPGTKRPTRNRNGVVSRNSKATAAEPQAAPDGEPGPCRSPFDPLRERRLYPATANTHPLKVDVNHHSTARKHVGVLTHGISHEGRPSAPAEAPSQR
jgi:hypothetical protein